METKPAPRTYECPNCEAPTRQLFAWPALPNPTDDAIPLLPWAHLKDRDAVDAGKWRCALCVAQAPALRLRLRVQRRLIEAGAMVLPTAS